MVELTHLEHHTLRDHPEFSLLLQKIAGEVDPTLPPIRVPAFFQVRGKRFPFLLDPHRFSVADAGRPTATLGCMVCGVGSRRQYGFFVECTDGVTRGPIGSACIFEHVLGAQRAKGYGVGLRGLVKDLPHYRLHREWLDAAPLDYDAYLRRAALTYLTDARLREQARLTRAQLNALEHSRSLEQPLSPDLYAVLFQRGQGLVVPSLPPPVPAERDQPLPEGLRIRARPHLQAVVQQVPNLIRAFVRRAVEDETTVVAPYIHHLIEETVLHLEHRVDAPVRSSTQSKPLPVSAKVRLAAPASVLIARKTELQPFLRPALFNTIFLTKGGKRLAPLTDHDRVQLNEAFQAADDVWQKRWARHMAQISADLSSSSLSELLWTALTVSPKKSLKALHSDAPLSVSTLIIIREANDNLANPQSLPALRTPAVFLNLIHVIAAHHRITKAIETLTKPTRHGSWLNALRVELTHFLQGKPFAVSGTLNILRHHQPTRGLSVIEIIPELHDETSRRWAEINFLLSPRTRAACLALPNQKTLRHDQLHELIRTLSRTRNPQPDQSLRTRANLTLTLAGQAFARGDLDFGQELAELANAESFKHPTQLNPQWTAYRDQKLVTLPAALRHISGAPPAALRAPEPIAIQRPKLLPNYQPLPDYLLAFIRAHPEAVLARCQQKTRAVVEQAMQESSPVAAGVIQLLQSIVQELSNT